MKSDSLHSTKETSRPGNDLIVSSKTSSAGKIDFKKAYKEFYLPKDRPCVIEIPKMNYIAVRGQGNPNDEAGEYKNTINLLYAVAYTIKMSSKSGHAITGFFEYVVPPLEGLWWQEGKKDGIDYRHKEKFQFISMIRLPDFVTQPDFDWAIAEATKKKNQDFSHVEFLVYDEGLCVQCMHHGSYDEEPATIRSMREYIADNNYMLDIQNPRYHHEIYLSDPRKCDAHRLKTVIRLPIKKR